MAKRALVFYNQVLAGYLEKQGGSFHFRYTEAYLADSSLPAIALAFPKGEREFHSKILFPFFCGLLSEGANMRLQCQLFNVDEEDYFSRLLKTAGSETIGAITVRGEDL